MSISFWLSIIFAVIIYYSFKKLNEYIKNRLAQSVHNTTEVDKFFLKKRPKQIQKGSPPNHLPTLMSTPQSLKCPSTNSV
jgi:hypothetical protein